VAGREGQRPHRSSVNPDRCLVRLRLRHNGIASAESGFYQKDDCGKGASEAVQDSAESLQFPPSIDAPPILRSRMRVDTEVNAVLTLRTQTGNRVGHVLDCCTGC
jgi:hypothetical protein